MLRTRPQGENEPWQEVLPPTHCYSQQDDILVGTPTGRRYLAESEDMIGLFINNLVLRARFAPQLTFRELLAQMRQATIDAFSNDELPFEDLVAALDVPRSRGNAPVFQHLFIHRNNTHSRWEIPGLKLSRVPLHSGGSKYDLTLSVIEEGARMSGTLEYSSDLYEHESAERIAAHYMALLGKAIESPDKPLALLDMLENTEREALLHQWNPAATPYPAIDPHQLAYGRSRRAADKRRYPFPRPHRQSAKTARLPHRTGEIETHLEAHPMVKQCVAVAREDGRGEKRLVAYLLANTNEPVDADALRSFARERVLLQAPTIRQLAEAINARFTPLHTVFVPLREGKPGAPVMLLVAGGGGHVFSFMNFARALPFDVTVYGVKPLGIDNIDELPKTFEGMAEKYVSELEEICPDGPFIVSG